MKHNLNFDSTLVQNSDYTYYCVQLYPVSQLCPIHFCSKWFHFLSRFENIFISIYIEWLFPEAVFFSNTVPYEFLCSTWKTVLMLKHCHTCQKMCTILIPTYSCTMGCWYFAFSFCSSPHFWAELSFSSKTRLLQYNTFIAKAAVVASYCCYWVCDSW